MSSLLAKMRPFVILFAVILATPLTRCSSAINHNHLALATESDCERPCWRGIEIGESSLIDVRTIMENDPLRMRSKGEGTITSVEGDVRTVSLTYSSEIERFTVYMRANDDVISEIQLWSLELDIQSLIEAIGPPHSLVVNRPNSSPYVENDDYQFDMIYPTLGIHVKAVVSPNDAGYEIAGDRVSLFPELMIYSVVFNPLIASTDDVHSAIQDWGSLAHQQADGYVAADPWLGYGMYTFTAIPN